MQTDTSYLGFRLPHPFIAGASPFGYYLDTVKRLEDAGWSAVVLHSLFVEDITGCAPTLTSGVAAGGGRGEPPLSVSAADPYPQRPDEYAEHVSRVKQAVRIPVIGSLNGTSTESWIQFARVIQQAGADALEMNLYEVVTDLDVSGTAVEERLCGIVTELKRGLTIPLAVKLSPFFAAFGNVARQLDRAGANALVLFNRFYQPDIDVKTTLALPHVVLSSSDELLLRLRWLAILYGRVRPALAVTGGVAVPDDGIKAILAGADAVQMTSALLRHGTAYVATMRRGLEEWMQVHEVPTLDLMRGLSSLQRTGEPSTFERASYIAALQSWMRHDG
ncbi:MAG TPA: dihydroorotate dehydrogenase-like protein [Vicinamibacterales bacterium]|nr:dihydroorotate dehydrogenase-like protein [Vicinamibacterales bacterium]